MRLFKQISARPQKHYALLLGEREIPLVVRTHPTSRRLILRYCERTKTARLTLPKRVSQREALKFVESRTQWLRAQIAATPEQISFTNDAVIPLRGVQVTLRSMSGQGRRVWREGDVLYVGGDEAAMPRRVRTWLQAEARAAITGAAMMHAKTLGVRIARINLRDPTSRWGSCGSDRVLSFSWRLILAPPEVLDYVVCHEVAHMLRMDHSPQFWRIVTQLCPHQETYRAWLHKHGQALHRFN